MTNRHSAINWARVIMVAAVLASMTRWTMALLDSEGIVISQEWMSWWKIAALIADVGMAVVEGVGFMYAFSAWKLMKNEKHQSRMIALIAFSAVTFLIVMTPAIVSHSQSKQVSDVVSGAALWIWGAGVVMSTVSVLSMVGYADGRMQEIPHTVVSVPVVSPVELSQKADKPKDVPKSPYAHYKDWEDHILSLNGAGAHTGEELRKQLMADGQPKATSYEWVKRLAAKYPEKYKAIGK